MRTGGNYIQREKIKLKGGKIMRKIRPFWIRAKQKKLNIKTNCDQQDKKTNYREVCKKKREVRRDCEKRISQFVGGEEKRESQRKKKKIRERERDADRMIWGIPNQKIRIWQMKLNRFLRMASS